MNYTVTRSICKFKITARVRQYLSSSFIIKLYTAGRLYIHVYTHHLSVFVGLLRPQLLLAPAHPSAEVDTGAQPGLVDNL